MNGKVSGVWSVPLDLGGLDCCRLSAFEALRDLEYMDNLDLLLL